jgi:hypothetical protein
VKAKNERDKRFVSAHEHERMLLLLLFSDSFCLVNRHSSRPQVLSRGLFPGHTSHERQGRDDV